jgi:hypothetical protein
MNNPDNISESLKKFFCVKSLMRIRDGKNSDPGQASRIRNAALYLS